ncbi:HTH domain-containing protein [Clostridioides difficile]
MNIIKVDSDYIENILDILIVEYDFNIDTLSNLLNVEKDIIKNYKKYEKSISYDAAHLSSIINKILMLYNITNTDADFKFRAYLYVLVDYHNISSKTIAKMANIEEKEVLDFINEKDTISIDTRYKLASVIMNLRFMLKDIEP